MDLQAAVDHCCVRGSRPCGRSRPDGKRSRRVARKSASNRRHHPARQVRCFRPLDQGAEGLAGHQLLAQPSTRDHGCPVCVGRQGIRPDARCSRRIRTGNVDPAAAGRPRRLGADDESVEGIDGQPGGIAVRTQPVADRIEIELLVRPVQFLARAQETAALVDRQGQAAPYASAHIAAAAMAWPASGRKHGIERWFPGPEGEIRGQVILQVAADIVVGVQNRECRGRSRAVSRGRCRTLAGAAANRLHRRTG